MFFKECLLFKDRWDEDREKEIQPNLARCAQFLQG
jgi:hypothetical protein